MSRSIGRSRTSTPPTRTAPPSTSAEPGDEAGDRGLAAARRSHQRRHGPGRARRERDAVEHVEPGPPRRRRTDPVERRPRRRPGTGRVRRGGRRRGSRRARTSSTRFPPKLRCDSLVNVRVEPGHRVPVADGHDQVEQQVAGGQASGGEERGAHRHHQEDAGDDEAVVGGPERQEPPAQLADPAGVVAHRPARSSATRCDRPG